MYRGAALIAALLAVSGCGIDPVSPKETRVDYAGFVNSADQAAIYANSQCAKINRLAVFKAEDVIDGRKGATFQCLAVPKCYPAEASAPGQPVGLTPGAAMPVSAPGAATPAAPNAPYALPATAASRFPGPVVAMAPVSGSRDRRSARRASGPADNAADDNTYIPYAAVPVAAGAPPQRVPAFATIAIPTGPNPVSVEADAAGPRPVGSFASTAAGTWQQAVTCKPNDTLPLATDRLLDLY